MQHVSVNIYIFRNIYNVAYFSKSALSQRKKLNELGKMRIVRRENREEDIDRHIVIAYVVCERQTGNQLSREA